MGSSTEGWHNIRFVRVLRVFGVFVGDVYLGAGSRGIEFCVVGVGVCWGLWLDLRVTLDLEFCGGLI